MVRQPDLNRLTRLCHRRCRTRPPFSTFTGSTWHRIAWVWAAACPAGRNLLSETTVNWPTRPRRIPCIIRQTHPVSSCCRFLIRSVVFWCTSHGVPTLLVSRHSPHFLSHDCSVYRRFGTIDRTPAAREKRAVPFPWKPRCRSRPTDPRWRIRCGVALWSALSDGVRAR